MFHAKLPAAPHALAFAIFVALAARCLITKTCGLTGFYIFLVCVRIQLFISSSLGFKILYTIEIKPLPHDTATTLHYFILRSNNAAFLATLNSEDPWVEEAAFTKLLMHDRHEKPAFHKIDLFHTVSLGVGKTFAAGSLSILQNLCNGNSVVLRLKEMTSLYLEYCREPFLFKWIFSACFWFTDP